MLLTSLGSEYWPQTPEGRWLCLLLSIYGFGVFGYLTATIASFFIGRDAEEKDAPLASSEDILLLQNQIQELIKSHYRIKVHATKTP
jgi:voltage-gated potassium channel